jgi:uncharacterized protein YqjF (DUF2071 family)
MSPSEILNTIAHRPWPLPPEPWIMTQVWYDLLFGHWRLPPASIRPLIPSGLELETFDGSAWIAITPFHMTMKARVPGAALKLSHFAELNCRTYVTIAGKPGVFFFSLDASSRLAVRGARWFYRLPYFYARIRVEEEGERIRYAAQRMSQNACFSASYLPTSSARYSRPGTLEHWLTERYCLYTVSAQHIYRCDIHHVPWPLQDATCEIEQNTIAMAAGVRGVEGNPLLHLAKKLEVLIWPLKRID